MHPNPAFRKASDQAAYDFAHERGFGILAINGPEGAPLTAHIPFTLSKDGATLKAHLVASNPVYRALAHGPVQALVSLSGPDSYVSPDWYVMPDQVPTWNYVAVNIRGHLDAAPIGDLPAFLDELSETFERKLLPKPVWTAAKTDPKVLTKLMRQIRPVSMQIEKLESTFKLGQNKPKAARESAAATINDNGIGHNISDLARLMLDVD